MNKNMNKYIIGLIALVGILTVFSSNLQLVNAADTQAATATADVVDTISVTLSGATISFGSLNSGTSNNAGGPLTITIDAITNVATDINQSATGDLSDGVHTNITVDNLTYYSANTVGSAVNMSTSYASPTLAAWENIPVGGGSKSAYYWLNIPAAQPAGTYTTTISIKATKH